MFRRVLLFSILISGYIVQAQCPNVDLTLFTQAEVDSFSADYPNCSILTNDLIVESIGTDVISNLNGLSGITQAKYLVIKQTEISNYTGLDNLEEVEQLTLWANANTTSLEGLTSLHTVGRFDMFFNNSMTNLSGIDNLSSIDFVFIFGNTSLIDISELSFLTTLDQLTIGGNILDNLQGLHNLESVFGDILISNEAISNLDELSSLVNVSGSLYISNNAVLEDISALSNIQSVFDLYVVESPNLINLDGLENIVSVTGTLRVGFNASLVDLSVFSSLVVVGDLDIYENENLISLNGLQNLTQIDRTLSILNNPNLTDILSLDNVSPFEVDSFAIANNGNLSVCDSELICALIASSGVGKTIINNGPDCNSIQEVEDMCLLGVEDETLAAQVRLFPNPAIHEFYIQLPDLVQLNSVDVYTVTGRRVASSLSATVDVRSLPSGVYFAAVDTERGSVIRRLIKE